MHFADGISLLYIFVCDSCIIYWNTFFWCDFIFVCISILYLALYEFEHVLYLFWIYLHLNIDLNAFFWCDFIVFCISFFVSCIDMNFNMFCIYFVFICIWTLIWMQFSDVISYFFASVFCILHLFEFEHLLHFFVYVCSCNFILSSLTLCTSHRFEFWVEHVLHLFCIYYLLMFFYICW